MAMQNRMQPQMRQPMPNQMPPTSNGPPGAQFANQRRRPMVSFGGLEHMERNQLIH